MALSGYVDLNEAKDQCVVERANPNHDQRLETLLAAAERAAVQFLNIDSLEDLEDSPPVIGQPAIPEDVKSAILLHVQIYFDRDEKQIEAFQKAFERLLWPYRIGLGV